MRLIDEQGTPTCRYITEFPFMISKGKWCFQSSYFLLMRTEDCKLTPEVPFSQYFTLAVHGGQHRAPGHSLQFTSILWAWAGPHQRE